MYDWSTFAITQRKRSSFICNVARQDFIFQRHLEGGLFKILLVMVTPQSKPADVSHYVSKAVSHIQLDRGTSSKIHFHP